MGHPKVTLGKKAMEEHSEIPRDKSFIFMLRKLGILGTML